MAPEILSYQKYDAKADLWSVGTILYELLVGRPPFTGANPMQLLKNIERSDAKIPGKIAAALSPECVSILRGLLRRDPVQRMSFEEFFDHPFLADPDARSHAGSPSRLISRVRETAAENHARAAPEPDEAGRGTRRGGDEAGRLDGEGFSRAEKRTTPGTSPGTGASTGTGTSDSRANTLTVRLRHRR